MDLDIDRVKTGLRAFIRATFPRIDYLALYPARVVTQNADKSLDLIPDDPRIGGHQSVPIRYGIPGVAVTVAPGARVLLGFAAGDPSQPIAELWESASVTELDLTATSIKLNGGTLSVGRVGDAVSATTNFAAWILAVDTALGALGQPVTPPASLGTIAAGAPGVTA